MGIIFYDYRITFEDGEGTNEKIVSATQLGLGGYISAFEYKIIKVEYISVAGEIYK